MIVYVPQDVYDRLQERLKNIPEKIPSTLKRTVNSTAKEAEKKWAAEIKKTYVLKSALRRVKKSISTEKATVKYPQATIEVKGGAIPLYDFQKRKNTKRQAAKARVLSGAVMKELKLRGGEDNGKDLKAFMTTVKWKDKDGGEGEHVGIFQRVTGAKRKGARNEIKQLYGPPIPEMAGNDDILSVLRTEIMKSMRENLETHIAEVMGEL